MLERAPQPCLNQLIWSCSASHSCLCWESSPTFSTWGWSLQGRTLYASSHWATSCSRPPHLSLWLPSGPGCSTSLTYRSFSTWFCSSGSSAAQSASGLPPGLMSSTVWGSVGSPGVSAQPSRRTSPSSWVLPWWEYSWPPAWWSLLSLTSTSKANVLCHQEASATSLGWHQYLCDRFHLLPHAVALGHHAPHLTEPGGLPLQTHWEEAEEQLGRVLPARLQTGSCSGLGLPHDAAHHLVPLPPWPLRVSCFSKHLQPQKTVE